MSAAAPSPERLLPPPYLASGIPASPPADGICPYADTMTFWSGVTQKHGAGRIAGTNASAIASSALPSGAATEPPSTGENATMSFDNGCGVIDESTLPASDLMMVLNVFSQVASYYGVDAQLRFFDDCRQANAYIIPATGELFFGVRQLLPQLKARLPSDLGVSYVIAHELTHRLQFLRTFHDFTAASPQSSQLLELGAEAHAGQYIVWSTLNAGRSYPPEAMLSLFDLIRSQGSPNDTAVDWHGTSKQRQASFAAGMATAREVAAGTTAADMTAIYTSEMAKIRDIAADPDCFGSP